MQILTVHSYKGGTGKTNLALNLAVIAANKAKRVALLELDLESPAIHNTFHNGRDKWMNDYLDGNAPLKDVLTDVSQKAQTEGLLHVGLANPDMKAVRKSVGGDRKSQLESLKRLMAVRDELAGYDYVFFDTSPGISYASVNAVLAADRTLLIAKPDSFDLDGTGRLIAEFYEGLDKKTGLVVNRVLTPEATDGIQDRIKVPLLATVPCYCEVAILDSASVFINEKPDHPFVQNMNELFDRAIAF